MDIAESIRREIARLQRALTVLEEAPKTDGRGRKRGWKMSVAGRERIAAAQRARWAKVKGKGKER